MCAVPAKGGRTIEMFRNVRGGNFTVSPGRLDRGRESVHCLDAAPRTTGPPLPRNKCCSPCICAARPPPVRAARRMLPFFFLPRKKEKKAFGYNRSSNRKARRVLVLAVVRFIRKPLLSPAPPLAGAKVKGPLVSCVSSCCFLPNVHNII